MRAGPSQRAGWSELKAPHDPHFVLAETRPLALVPRDRGLDVKLGQPVEAQRMLAHSES